MTHLNKPVLSSLVLAALAVTGTAAHAQAQLQPQAQAQAQAQAQTQFQPQSQPQEMGRVVSSTPVIQQVAVPRQICNNQPVAVQPQKSGSGAVMGALAGGVLGNVIGSGGGRAAATILGAFGGAVVGDQVEGSQPSYVQNVQQCSTQTFYENRTVGYNVVYDYAGRQYNVQMPHDPGQYVRLQVTPVGAAAAPMDGNVVATAPMGQPATIIGPTVIESGVVTVPSQIVYPATYARPYYYPPVGVSLNFGYSRGYYGGRHGHGHWR